MKGRPARPKTRSFIHSSASPRGGDLQPELRLPELEAAVIGQEVGQARGCHLLQEVLGQPWTATSSPQRKEMKAEFLSLQLYGFFLFGVWLLGKREGNRKRKRNKNCWRLFSLSRQIPVGALPGLPNSTGQFLGPP